MGIGKWSKTCCGLLSATPSPHTNTHTHVSYAPTFYSAGEYTFDDEPDSSLVLSGKWQDGKGGLNAIVGGTGRFSGASGEGKYKVDEDNENWSIVKITLYE